MPNLTEKDKRCVIENVLEELQDEDDISEMSKDVLQTIQNALTDEVADFLSTLTEVSIALTKLRAMLKERAGI